MYRAMPLPDAPSKEVAGAARLHPPDPEQVKNDELHRDLKQGLTLQLLCVRVLRLTCGQATEAGLLKP